MKKRAHKSQKVSSINRIYMCILCFFFSIFTCCSRFSITFGCVIQLLRVGWHLMTHEQWVIDDRSFTLSFSQNGWQRMLFKSDAGRVFSTFRRNCMPFCVKLNHCRASVVCWPFSFFHHWNELCEDPRIPTDCRPRDDIQNRFETAPSSNVWLLLFSTGEALANVHVRNDNNNK